MINPKRSLVGFKHAYDAEPRGDHAQAGNDEDHQNAEEIARKIELAGADQPLGLGRGDDAAPEHMGEQRQEQEGDRGGERADQACPDAEPEEMTLELAADE